MRLEELALIKSTLYLELKAIEHKENTIRLIQRAIEKRQVLSSSEYYNVFGGDIEKIQDLEKIDKLINRLINYLNNKK